MSKIFYLYLHDLDHGLYFNPEENGVRHNYRESIKSNAYYYYDIIDEALFTVFLLKYSDKLKRSKII